MKKKSFKDRIITTADLYSKEKKGKKSKMITTADLPDVLPNQPTGEEAKPITTTENAKESEKK